MNWIKITNEDGGIDRDKLPKSGKVLLYCRCGYVFEREMEIMNPSNAFLAEMGATHFSPIHGPNEPQPEDGLVEAIEKVKNIADSGAGKAISDQGADLAGIGFFCEQALAQWEAGR